jgi:5'-hydroxyaverantin dehydrogenase
MACVFFGTEDLIEHSDDPPEPSTAILDVNFKGVYLTTYLALHYFRRASLAPPPETQSVTQILFISSLLAYLEAPMNLSYCGSKHGVRGIFRSLRWEGAELGAPGLQVNLIAPTLVKTPMTRDFWAYLQDVRGFAMSMPEEIVDVGIRLLSDPGIDGRAVAVIPGSEAVDLCDDFEGADGGRESLKLVDIGVLGKGPSATGRFIV